jgi:hypothetical protein
MGGVVREWSTGMDARVNQLQPTMFVDAVPELAAARMRREDTDAPPSAEDEPAWDGEEPNPLDVAARSRCVLCPAE